VQYGFSELITYAKNINCGDIQIVTLSPHKQLNILFYRAEHLIERLPVSSYICRSYNFSVWFSFWPALYWATPCRSEELSCYASFRTASFPHRFVCFRTTNNCSNL